MRKLTSSLAVVVVLGALMAVWIAPAAADSSITVNVPAYADSSTTQPADPWVASGVTLEPGASITVTAAGQAQTSPTAGATNPDGISSLCHAQCLAPGIRTYALVARIGTGSIVFVGVGPTTLTNNSSTPGEVFFAYNDSLFIYHDNSGSYDVTIQGIHNVCVLHEESRAVKSGAAYPLKFQLCDTNGNNVSSPSHIVTATHLTNVSAVTGGVIEDIGSANPDDNFRYSEDLAGYIFNKSTKGLSSGSWKMAFSVDGVHYTGYSVQFGVK